MQEDLISNICSGWVPFPYFQQFMIIILVFGFINYKKINEKLNKNVYSKIQKKFKNNKITNYSRIIISLLPNFIILYLDLNFRSFSMKHVGITNYISNDSLNTMLKLAGAYCIVQVAAQDIGLKTGDIQADFVKVPLFQFVMYCGVAFSLTQNRSMSIIAALLYFQMKFFISNGNTKDVCFE